MKLDKLFFKKCISIYHIFWGDKNTYLTGTFGLLIEAVEKQTVHKGIVSMGENTEIETRAFIQCAGKKKVFLQL